ncbi:MAG: transcriptional regulator NrdR [Candidatus Hydrogenedentota bacterium]
MICPGCNAEETGVIDSRTTEHGMVIRRRRECEKCGRRFTTYERMEQEPIYVVKKDGTRELFSREKLLKGIMTACRKTSLPLETLEEFVASIERTIRDEGGREVDSVSLGKEVLSGLKLLDPVAYIRFASVYKEFDSVESFRQTLADFEEKKS